jgi:hypothetical protein
MKSTVNWFITAYISETTRRFKEIYHHHRLFVSCLFFDPENGGDIFFRYLALSSKQNQFAGGFFFA